MVKSKESVWKNFHRYAQQFFLGQSFALQPQFTIDILFRTAVSRKLFDIRFSYKHCNFLRVCLLVKMASKTVTRSMIKMRKTEKNAIVIEAATLSHRASYRRVQKNLSKSLNLKSPLKGHLSVVCCFFRFIPLKTTSFCFSYSPRTTALKVLLRKIAWLPMLS